jgi:hypothetical protein
MSLNDIVNVTITKETQAITQPSFSVINLLSPDTNFTDRIRFYDTSDLATLALDLCGGAGNITYGMALAIVAQSPAVNEIAVSCYAVSKHIWFKGTYTAGTFLVTVNDIPISVAYHIDLATTLGDVATAIETATGLTADYNASAYTNGATVINISASTARPISVSDISVTSQTGTMVVTVTSTPIVLTFSGTMTGGKITTILNGVAYDTLLATDLAGTITALSTQLAALTSVYTTLSTSTTITVVPANGTALKFDFDLSNCIGAATKVIAAFNYGTETVTAALTAVATENNEWYGALLVDAMSSAVTSAGHVTNDTAKQLQLDFQTWVEANKKFAAMGSSDGNIVDLSKTSDLSATGPSLACAGQSAGYARSKVLYSESADIDYIDAGYLGKVLPLTPGSWTGKFKTLATVSTDVLTGTQVTNAEAKNANINIYVAGINMIEQGNTCDGEWDDVIVFIDYIVADIQANVFSVLSQASKVPYDDGGINSIVAAIQKSGEKGIAVGGLTALQNDSKGNTIGGYKVTAPLFSTVSANDRNNRILNNVKFTFYLSGAIHAVTINGVVTTA